MVCLQKELQSLVKFAVPRFYRLSMVSPTSIQLYLFGDTSEKAFCAVAYFLFEYPGGEKECVFVAAKTCVAPVKPVSVPRLEWQAAVLSVRLACVIQKEHYHEMSSTCYWSDSSAIIGQIRGESRRHPARKFTVNRLSEILDTSEPPNNGVTTLVNR